MPARYDLIGDLHGCLPELRALLARLGYRPDLTHPAGRQLVFLGDLVDRGPDTPGTLRLVMDAVGRGAALCVQGNHDWRLAACLRGERVKVSPGLQVSLAQLAGEPISFLHDIERFLANLPSRLTLDGGRLLVVHAGERADLPEPERARYAVHGLDTGIHDEHGVELREDWAALYRGPALVVAGHTPLLHPRWTSPNAAGGRTVNIDTGCVFGGALSALRYPELATLAEPAHHTYAVSRRLAAQQSSPGSR